MTIKQQGGIFGRNPSFNDVEANQGTFSDLLSTTSMVSGGSNKTVGSYGNSHVRSDSNAAAYNGGNLSFGGKSVATGGQYIFGGLKFMSDPASGTGWDTYASLYLTNADSSVSEKVFFKNNGDINPTGNVVVNSGNGIDFSATSGTGTSELFNDYEEGTWTATLASGATTTPTATGYYTKVGNIVSAQLVAAFGSLTVNGTALQISGLPFASAFNVHFATAAYNRVAFNTAKNQFWALDATTTTLKLFENGPNASTIAAVNSEASGTFTPVFDIISFVYRAA